MLVRTLLVTILALSTSALAERGNENGGGGTFVQVAGRNGLVFWDLYVHNPGFVDTTPGDQVQMRHRTQAKGDWIDYRRLKSFLFLKQRLKLWQGRASQLISEVTDRGTMLRPGDANDPEGFYYLLIGTPNYIQRIDEISVPKHINTINLVAYPGAFYVSATERIFLSIPVFNRAGLISQAAMLFHERLREIQQDYNITNEQLQSIVYNILLKEPGEVGAAEYDDSWFSPLNYNPKPQLLENSQLAEYIAAWGYNNPGLTRAMYKTKINSVKFRVEIGFTCNADPDARACMRREYFDKFRNDADVKLVKAETGGDLLNADSEVAKAEALHILGPVSPGPFLLSSNSNDNTTVQRPRLASIRPGQYALEPKQCDQVVAAHRDPKYVNTYREILGCDQDGWLKGSGGLIFTSPVEDEFAVQVKGSLFTGNDGGSRISVNALGLSAHIHNQGGDALVIRIENSTHTVPLERPKQLHAYVFRFRFKERRVEIVLNDDGKYLSNTPLMIWTMPNDVLKNHDKIGWSYYTHNLSKVEHIRVLPIQPEPVVPVVGPFENWNKINQSGIAYISMPGQVCKWGYQSEYYDQASHRHQCHPLNNYDIKAGQACGPGFVATHKYANGGRMCLNLKNRDAIVPTPRRG